MSTVNHHTREINFKIVYYGPGLSGKTTCLQYIHRSLRPDTRGPLVMLPTDQDRTIYFDFLPLKLPKLAGYTTRIHLYTVPGQVHYNSTRQLVLSGADGVAFVADSQPDRLDANLESLRNLQQNLRERHAASQQVPLVILYNKRDVPEALPRASLEAKLNGGNVGSFETVATRGTGVLESLQAIVRLVLQTYRQSAQQQQQRSASSQPESPTERPTGPQPQIPRPPPPAPREPPAASDDEEPSSITITSIGAISTAIDRFVGTSATRGSTTRRGALSLAGLVSTARAAGAVAALETRIAEADWAGTVRMAAEACAELPLLFSCAPRNSPDAAAMVAFVAGMPPDRYFRFQEAVTRTSGNGAVTVVDAVYALFFYCDLAMRLEERQSAEQRVRQSEGKASEDEE